MLKRFLQIFWGLFLVIVDLKINHIDILPDFVGYIFIALGCGGLTEVSRKFATAQTASWILAALAVLKYVPMDRDITAVLSFVRLVADCAMMWFLLGGVMELAAHNERLDLFNRAASCRSSYVFLICLTTIVEYAPWPGELKSSIGIAALVFMLVILFLILHLFHRITREMV
jgi:hypothetical protein